MTNKNSAAAPVDAHGRVCSIDWLRAVTDKHNPARVSYNSIAEETGWRSGRKRRRPSGYPMQISVASVHDMITGTTEYPKPERVAVAFAAVCAILDRREAAMKKVMR